MFFRHPFRRTAQWKTKCTLQCIEMHWFFFQPCRMWMCGNRCSKFMIIIYKEMGNWVDIHKSHLVSGCLVCSVGDHTPTVWCSLAQPWHRQSWPDDTHRLQIQRRQLVTLPLSTRRISTQRISTQRISTQRISTHIYVITPHRYTGVTSWSPEYSFCFLNFI